MKKLVLITLIITIIAAGVGWFYYQKNIFSEDVLRFEIVAPGRADLGDMVEYILRYKNNGDIRLEDASIVFEYPRNSFPQESEDEDIIKRGDLRREIYVGDIDPGEEGSISFSARLFGKEGTVSSASAWINYRPRNLNVRYESKREHSAIIESASITFDLEIPSTVESEKETYFRLRYFSNIDHPLTNLEVRMEYPSGFTFESSSPQREEEGEWTIPVLNRAEGGVIEIVGSIEGEPREPKVFKATLGIWRGNVFIPLKEVSRGTSIAIPSLFISMQANNSPRHIANPSEFIYYELFFKNIGEETMENLFLMVQLDRDIFDFEEVEPINGRFQKEAGSIIWNHTLAPQLRYLSSGEEGSVSFWVKVDESLPRNPEGRVTVILDGAREEFTTMVNTQMALFQEIITEESPFESTGPFPLTKGVASTYTVKLEALNYYTDARDVTVKTTLPPEAKITGEIDPEESSLSFDSRTGEVVWNIENLQGGTGTMRPSKKIFFEVSIVPGEETEELAGEAVMRGEDTRTKEIVTAKAPAVIVDASLLSEDAD